MKRLLIFTSIFTLLLSTLIFAEKKQWKRPELKEGQTIQEAFEELRQNKQIKIEKRKQEVIQERKNNKKIEKASRSEATRERKEQKEQEKKNRGLDFSNKYDKKQEKKMRRMKASESQIDRLEPRKFEINDLTDFNYENVLLEENKAGKNIEK